MPTSQSLADAKYRFATFLRRCTGRSLTRDHGCLWRVRTPNALRRVRLLHQENPLLGPFVDGLREDDVLVDVGANFGACSVLAAHGPAPPRTVYAVEPSPAPFLALLDHLDLNGCNERVVPLAVALGADVGYADFTVNSLDPSAGTSHVDTGNPEEKHLPRQALWEPRPMRTRVPVTTLDALVQDEVLDPPTAVKIDVEGYENRVLDGMASVGSGVRTLYLEAHPGRLAGDTDLDGLLARVEALGLSRSRTEEIDRQLHLLFER